MLQRLYVCVGGDTLCFFGVFLFLFFFFCFVFMSREKQLKVGSWCFQCIIILLIYFLNCPLALFYMEISKFQLKVQSYS